MCMALAVSTYNDNNNNNNNNDKWKTHSVTSTEPAKHIDSNESFGSFVGIYEWVSRSRTGCAFQRFSGKIPRVQLARSLGNQTKKPPDTHQKRVMDRPESGFNSFLRWFFITICVLFLFFTSSYHILFYFCVHKWFSMDFMFCFGWGLKCA